MLWEGAGVDVRPSPLGARGGMRFHARLKGSRRAAGFALGPRGPRRKASPGLLGLLWAVRRKSRDDAFLKGRRTSRPFARFAGVALLCALNRFQGLAP